MSSKGYGPLYKGSKLFVKNTRCIMEELYLKGGKDMKKVVITLPRSKAMEVKDELIEMAKDPNLSKEDVESITMRIDSITKALEAENHALEAQTHAVEAQKRGGDVVKIVITGTINAILLILIMLFEKFSDCILPRIVHNFTPRFSLKN